MVGCQRKAVVIAMVVGDGDGGSGDLMSNGICFATTTIESNGAMGQSLYYTKCSDE